MRARMRIRAEDQGPPLSLIEGRMQRTSFKPEPEP